MTIDKGYYYANFEGRDPGKLFAKIAKNRPAIIDKFAVIRADGAELALRFYEMVQIDGLMPEGGHNRVRIAVASIPALLAMKGFALEGRYKQKDAYDVYYCVRNFPGGHGILAEACRPLIEHQDAIAGYEHINAKFETVESFGPTSVRRFVEETRILQERTPDQWQQDAFGQVDAWLRALGLRNEKDRTAGQKIYLLDYRRAARHAD